MATGQRDHEGRRRSGIWLPDQCWDWLTANTAEGMTRSDLVEGLILLAMDNQAADPAPTDGVRQMMDDVAAEHARTWKPRPGFRPGPAPEPPSGRTRRRGAPA